MAVTISGSPPVLRVPLGAFNTLPSATPGSAGQFDQELPLLSVHAFVGAGNGAGTAAQQAVQAALLQHAGIPFAAQPRALEIFGLPNWAQEDLQGLAPVSGPPPGGPVYAAARRLAALPAAARHAWLAAHLAALRSGQLTLGQLPSGPPPGSRPSPSSAPVTPAAAPPPTEHLNTSNTTSSQAPPPHRRDQAAAATLRRPCAAARQRS